MGASESTLSEVENVEGFQVMRVSPNSPAHLAGLVPFFDFIVGVDTLFLEDENSRTFKNYIAGKKDEPVKLHVFSLRQRSVREVVLTPTDKWGGLGVLGCQIMWQAAATALETSWHVTEVFPNSPAFVAGLRAHQDYLLGMQPPFERDVGITLFVDNGDFHTRMAAVRNGESLHHTSLLFLVYDSVDNAVKEVCVQLNNRDASLGMDVASGYLHAVPAAPSDSTHPVIKKFFVASAAPVQKNCPVYNLPPQAQQQQQYQQGSGRSLSNSSLDKNEVPSPVTMHVPHAGTTQQPAPPVASTSPLLPNGSGGGGSAFPHPPPSMSVPSAAPVAPVQRNTPPSPAAPNSGFPVAPAGPAMSLPPSQPPVQIPVHLMMPARPPTPSSAQSSGVSQFQSSAAPQGYFPPPPPPPPQ